MATPRPNPYSAFNFKVTIGTTVVAFQEVSGLDSENQTIDYREGTDPINAVRKLPGLEKYPAVVCKRGIAGDMTLWDWRKEVRDATSTVPPYRNVTIELLDEKGTSVMKWTLTNAWCSKLSGPSLNGKGNEIAIESMELAHDRMDIF
jgi:phage tail-like protein